MTKTKWEMDWIKAIRAAKTDDEFAVLIDKIYTEGFEDGVEEGIEDSPASLR